MTKLVNFNSGYNPEKYQIVKYSSEYKEAWDNLVKVSCVSHFLFYRNYMDYHSDRFLDHSLLVYDNDEKLVALFPANETELAVISHGGLTFGGLLYGNKLKTPNVIDIFYSIIDYYRNRDIKKIIYKPSPWTYHVIPAEADLYCMNIFGFKIKERHLASSIAFQSKIPLAGGRKNQIQKARKNNVLIQESEDWDSFVMLLADILQSRHNAIPVHSAAELRLLKHRFPDNIKLLTAKRDNELLAGTVLYITSTAVHTQYLASSDEGLALGALDILIKYAMDMYEQSKKYFCFGISTETNGKILNVGLLYQKESFGARAVVHDVWELEL